MSLADSLNAKAISTDVVREAASIVANKIKSACSPGRLILFGSAAEGGFRDGSDLDFLLVFEDPQMLDEARKKIRNLGLLHPEIPVDLIFMSRANFDSKKELGGVAFIAHHEGVDF